MIDEPAGETGKQVIARAAAVLQTLETRPAGLNMSQIARASGLPRTTVQRLVGSLAAQQFLSIDGTGRVRLGPALARLAAAAHVDVTAIIHPHMEALRQQIGETVHLWAATDRDTVLVDQIVGDHEVRVVAPIGVRYPLACTAGGKAILASLTDPEVRKLVEGHLTAHTPHTILSIEALLADLANVRSLGMAYDLEEHAEDVCAVGTVLHTTTNDRLALCIAAPARRFHNNRDRFAQAVIRCRNGINDDLCA